MYKERWQPVFALVLGIYIIASPWLMPEFLASPKLTLEPEWSHYFTGIAIVIIAIFAMTYFGAWTVWLEALLGMWLILAPWVLGFSLLPIFTWSSVIVGIALIVSSLGSLTAELLRST